MTASSLQISKPQVVFFGLGARGGGMARLLLNYGFEVFGFDVYRPSADIILKAGGRAVCPKELAENSDVIIAMEASGGQVKSVLFDRDNAAVHGLRPGAAIVVGSTVPPDFSGESGSRLFEDLARPDVFYLNCPVSGGAIGAAIGTRSIFSSGPDEELETARPVLESLSAKLDTIAGGMGSGSKSKMCHQVLPDVEIALTSETMALVSSA